MEIWTEALAVGRLSGEESRFDVAEPRSFLACWEGDGEVEF